MGLFGEILSAYVRGDTGAYGEALTDLELRFVNFFGRDGITLRNLYLPKDDGTTSEIDLLYITQKGIFVIESKNYSGWIFGNGEDQYWTQSLPNKQKQRFYNPIKQNQTHIKWLLNYLGEDIPIFSMIVFSERCELKKIDFQGKNVCLCKRDELFGSIRYYWKRSEDALSPEKTVEIAEKLKPLTNADEAVKLAHIEDINRKYLKQTAKKEEPQLVQEVPQPEQDTASRICPRCGAELVLRTAKKGENAGKQFYGCSAFPKCRYMQDIDQS